MTIKECYAQMEADYEGVLGRLGSDSMIRRYLVRFVQTDEMQKLEQALQEGSQENAFTCAHNMKGIGLNLGLTRLFETSAVFCDLVRTAIPALEDYEGELCELQRAYQCMKEAVNQMESGTDR